MIMKIIPALSAFLFVTIAQSLLSQSQPFVYDFLRNDYSARSSAMAGAFVTVAGDPNGLNYNPALLNTIDSTTPISFTAFKHLLDINSGSLAGASRFDGIGVLGASISFNTYGSFQRTDRNGNASGEFGSQDLIINVGWGNELGEGFSAGVGGQAIFSSIDEYSSFALALDAGLYFQDTVNNIQAGASLLHLGSQLSSFGEENEELPLDLKIGVSHELRGLPLLLALNFSRMLDESDNFLGHFSSFAIGGEFTISDPLRLRFGYNNRVRQDVTFGGSKGLGGLSAGVGILVDQYRFDYAFNSLAGLGGMHRITLNASL
ncbi:MAG: PorV/PorQ family protein [Chlorobi bacterium]|nr:PorV/PorQ family protein [Chlorobiota bacterium]